MILALPAHAKLNLSLEVRGLQADGRHELSTVFQAISLHDLLLAEPARATELVGGQPDDLVLRAQSGEAPEELAQWWERFQRVSEADWSRLAQGHFDQPRHFAAA